MFLFVKRNIDLYLARIGSGLTSLDLDDSVEDRNYETSDESEELTEDSDNSTDQGSGNDSDVRSSSSEGKSSEDEIEGEADSSEDESEDGSSASEADSSEDEIESEDDSSASTVSTAKEDMCFKELRAPVQWKPLKFSFGVSHHLQQLSGIADASIWIQ